MPLSLPTTARGPMRVVFAGLQSLWDEGFRAAVEASGQLVLSTIAFEPDDLPAGGGVLARITMTNAWPAGDDKAERQAKTAASLLTWGAANHIALFTTRFGSDADRKVPAAWDDLSPVEADLFEDRETYEALAESAFTTARLSKVGPFSEDS